jgi:hypothetical protein
VEFRTIDYTNNPAIIAQVKNITAINSALEIDLTGQATAESIGKTFYSGIGGHADFMRGAVLASGGKTILVLQSTARDGTVSRVVPFLKEGAGVTLTRGDIHYVVTEYGIAYLHGKNIRERAMSIISIAHPKFRPYLIEEARKQSLIYRDQTFITGKGGEYPEELEAYKTTQSGLRTLLRPVRISDEPLIKDFFYSLSEGTMHKRFMQPQRSIPHEVLQESSTMGRQPIFLSHISIAASSIGMSGVPVKTFFFMTFVTLVSRSILCSSNTSNVVAFEGIYSFISLSDKTPITLFCLSITGRCFIVFSFSIFITSERGLSGFIV